MIEYIKLKGYKRFSLVGNSEFELTIKEMVVVILGTNGSGKSALLSQLTPNPPVPGDFEKDGSKEIHLYYRSKRYILKAIFFPQPRYWFECDGQVLNNWGTQSVQRSLVEEHFNLTNKTFSLMQGSTLFSKMSLTERKDWIVALCNTDYEYAVSLYNKAKEKQRDLQGAIKIAKKRLADETAKKISDTDFKQLVEQAKYIEQLLDDLYQDKQKAQQSSSFFEEELIEQDRSREKITLQLNKIKEKTKYIEYDKSTYQYWITSITQKIQYHVGIIERYNQENKNLSDRISILERSNEETAAQLQDKIKKIEDKLEINKNKLLLEHKPTTLLPVFNRVTDSVYQLLIAIPDNGEFIYSQSKLEKSLEELKQDRRKLHVYQNEQGKIHAKLEHMDAHRDNKNITCPKCSHQHSTVFIESDYLILQKRDENAVTAIKTQENKIQQLEHFIEQCTKYLDIIKAWNGIKRISQDLDIYWQWLEDKKVFINASFNKTNYLEEIKNQLLINDRVTQLTQELQEHNELLKQIKEVEKIHGTESTLNVLRKLKEEITNTQEKSNAQISIYKRKKELFEQYLSILNQKQSLENQITIMRDRRQSLLDNRSYALYCEHYDELIKTVQITLANQRQTLHEATYQKQNIETLENNIATMQEEESHFNILANELSPKNGLIAQGLYGFIEQFFSDVNSIIEQVWTYSMRLLARDPSMDEEKIELDYRFPVEIIKSEKILLKDVAHGEGASKGQKEIIDLAFLVAAMTHLELNDFALFLDEIGSSFDEEHKKNLIVLLKQLIDARAFPQIFMVSHDYFQYTALNAQVVVLDSSNIKIK